jgi:hypothetical chaperone protein
MDYLGVDFGTTNSLAGVVDINKKLQLVPLEGESYEMPSAIFLKLKDKESLAFNEEDYERRVQSLLNADKARYDEQNASILKQLEDFRRVHRPRLKTPKPYDFINTTKYLKALDLYERDKNDYPRILEKFEQTRVVEEEAKLKKYIQPLKPVDEIRREVKALMVQQLLDDEAELNGGQTFFTALNDPNVIRFYGQEAIEEYKNNPMSGFFMRSPKAFLGVKLADAHIQLFIRTVTLILTEIKTRAESYLGKEFNGIILGRPVNYMGSHSDNDNNQALYIMRQAARLSGFIDVRFVVEPMAASLVISRTMFDSNVPALVIDVGGGTSDIILLDVNSSADEKLNVLGAVGERIGGNDFDESLAKKKFAQHIGANSQIIGGGSVPNHFVMDALSTRDIHKQAAFRKAGIQIHSYLSQVSEPAMVERLYQMFQMQLQHEVLLISEEAKIRLSENESHVSNFTFFNDPFSVSLYANELSSIYTHELNGIHRNVKSILADCLPSNSTYRVFLTGGMAKCSTLIESIKDLIPKGTVINRISALQGVVAGLAVVARSISLSEDAHDDNFSVRGIPVTR